MEWTVAIGVDTHKKVHVAVALDALGARLDSREITTTRAGYESLLSWAQALGLPVFAVEGSGSYGAGLVRFLEQAGVSVYECERPRRQERRRGKSDLIDAALAARRLLAGERLSLPRGGGRREDLRLLLLPMDHSYVRHLLPRLARKAGVERRVHAHGLRHAFAVDLVRSGAPLYVVRDALGHASVATTQVYLSRVGAHEAVEAMRNREWQADAAA